MIRPEFHVQLSLDPIDREMEERLDARPRCAHCGMNAVRRHGLLCLKCVRRLVRGLNGLLDAKGVKT